MLPQEKFAYKYLYEGKILGILPVITTKQIEAIIEECNLKYKKGKNINDLRRAIWSFGSLGHKSIDSNLEWVSKKADEVLTINWATLKI